MSTLREHAEVEFLEEIQALQKIDKESRPTNWELSPQAVVDYLMGKKLANGFIVTPKYIGDRRLMEIAVATLTTDRALLLYGIPGTGKSWVSEHIAAAISGDSKLLIQGTSGTSEESIRYGWNYAKLLAEGPSEDALVSTPLMAAMKTGKIARIEELTRISADVQDNLITILSEKLLPIPEINTEVQAQKGFNVIATANNKDKGVNDLSSALKRRFNTVILPTPKTAEEEINIVTTRVAKMAKSLELPVALPTLQDIQRIVSIFRELRMGVTEDGRIKIKSPSSTMSTAEAISVVNSGLSLSAYFGDGKLNSHDIASSLIGAIVKDPIQDKVIWEDYLDTVVKPREGWKDIYRACKEVSL
ncbi:AAA family ATPase [Cellulophaga sp. L1A9]|uniref:ATP-binding protein n=1 Tax=Cellulophaga sp. L1A9 TaxID=2686362 RepID=UPI00131AC06D|nr:AAA family ATPase [Cellulophaga sp. L1A9]